MSYRSKIRMSIGWIYPIGIFSSYIILFLEFELRRILIQGNYEIHRFPYFTIILVALMFITLGIIQWFRYRNWIYPVLGFLVGITTAQVSFIFQDYREKLSFDQLCSSLADIFNRFLDYYKNGLESRIIIELKSAK